MPGAFAPRFTIEAAFLILLGVGAGYADLRPAVIVALLAAGWILVVLIELAIWRSQSRSVPSATPGEPVSIEDEADPELEPEPEPELPPAPVEARDEYPLRSNTDGPSEEVEEYTRILSGASSEEPASAQGSE